MKIIDKETLGAIFEEIKNQPHKYENVRAIVNSRIDLCDLIPACYATKVVKLVKLMYNPADKGRGGKTAETADRIDLLIMNGADAIPFREFFAHKMGKTDIYDSLERICYEKKTGTGDWLYCEDNDFDACIAKYCRKRTKIRWDYVRADKGIDIHIECSYREFFDYLTAYNPDKGLATWFVRSSRTHSDGLNTTYIWKMQEIMTSKKKVAYLNSWGK